MNPATILLWIQIGGAALDGIARVMETVAKANGGDHATAADVADARTRAHAAHSTWLNGEDLDRSTTDGE